MAPTLTVPSNDRFQHRVAFDNLPLGEATNSNTPSFTINVKHKGYRAGRRSRTFMVGIDGNTYSDYALQWLLDELVDDGDEVVCVRVIEKDVRVSPKVYQEDAQGIMKSVLERNTANHALSFVLEYAGGKLHGTFQKLVGTWTGDTCHAPPSCMHMYQPAMLIVGTRGRSLGGLQGLVNTRNSFSKYCLQYSPVPVVVVRPTEKRIKKKERRAADSTRKTYQRMLAANHGKHEADSDSASTYDLEVQISPDEEAHQVAKVLGLPASFDPTIKPLAASAGRLQRASSTGASSSPLFAAVDADANAAARENDKAKASSGDADGEQTPIRPTRTTNSESSEGEEDDDDEEDGGDGEFEVVSGQQALDQQKLEQLHKMEVGEAAALRMKVDSDEESDEEENGKATS
ncbi:Universal stress protein family [Geosmithia morbida]|uniref:Universal stress protein family n=1 Tax=Geosmithia morbida TaxID=1094350 RepID=A0A9P5D217_9HYPO|nr:Universal stress protein family [Geosmithia morbida]KAF4120365.1 Universal stress protein family [Geosmithia morbida]